MDEISGEEIPSQKATVPWLPEGAFYFWTRLKCQRTRDLSNTKPATSAVNMSDIEDFVMSCFDTRDGYFDVNEFTIDGDNNFEMNAYARLNEFINTGKK